MSKIGEFFRNTGRKIGEFAKKGTAVGRKIGDTVRGISNKVLPFLEAAALNIPILGEVGALGLGELQLGINAVTDGLDIADNLVNRNMDLGDAIKQGIGLAGDVSRSAKNVKEAASEIKQKAPEAWKESKKIIQNRVSDTFNRGRMMR